MWDREYSLTASFNFDLTVEIAHGVYYRFEGTLDLATIGFGVQAIAFEESPAHYCWLYYLDGRLLQTNLALETNSKPCTMLSKSAESMGFNYDSRDRLQPQPASAHVSQTLSSDNSDKNKENQKDIVERIYDWCHFEKDYE